MTHMPPNDAQSRLCKQLLTYVDGDYSDLEAEDATTCIAKTLSSLYFAIFHIWLDRDCYVCFQEGQAAPSSGDAVSPCNATLSDGASHLKASDALSQYVDGFADPASIPDMRAFIDMATLPARLASANSTSHEFHRMGGGWTRAQFLVAHRNAQGVPTHVILVVSDIDGEKELAAREEQALFEAQHDALTGALNRKAFDSLMASDAYSGVRVGFALVDVDKFKGINDGLGHGVGDEVLAKVVEVLGDALRPNDTVFRIGGDEFAVLLTNCDESMWHALCGKVERAHTALSMCLPDAAGVTLSLGVCFNPSGLEKWMYGVADAALYHTKRMGRAGCTLMSKDRTVLHSWRDENASVESLAVLGESKVGVMRIEVPKDPHLPPRFYCGDVASELYGFSADMQPEQRFAQWYKGLQPAFVQVVEEAAFQMLDGETVECTFMWSNGEEPFAVRSVGVGKREEDRDVFYGYHRSLRGTVTVGEATLQAETEQSLRRATQSLKAALKAANQIGYEYDPSSRVATLITEESMFDLPRRIENCPDCLRGADLLHPEDEPAFFKAAATVQAGSLNAQCDVRIMTNGEYRWYSCEFNVQRDFAFGRDRVTVLLTDVTLRIVAKQLFEDRMESLLYRQDGTLSVGLFNLTQRTVKELSATRGVFVDGAGYSYQDALQAAAAGIIDPAARERYIRTFSCESLIALAESGETRLDMECLFRVEPGRTEWIEISAEIVRNPATADYEAIGFIRSINELYLASKLVDDSLHGPGNSAAILVDGGDEFYLYDLSHGESCCHKHDFWTAREDSLRLICSPKDFERVGSRRHKQRILADLEQGRSPKFTFDAVIGGQKVRLENSFTKFQDESGFILSKTRNITDEEMVEKLRHDARHDALTGLYNRETVFARCRMLLDQHPHDQFAMVKLNVRRFRMYNAFFGEDAGDELLRAIADSLRKFSGIVEYAAYGRIEADVFCAFFPYNEGVFMRHMEQVEKRFKTFRNDFLLEPSIGVYVVSDRSLSVEGMFARASSAAKEGGTRVTSCVSRYNQELERKLEEEIRIASEMQSALDQGQFAVYLQPKYNLQTGSRAGAEALVRWINPSQGIVLPGRFIPLFESNGFITSLDQYVWEHVCGLLRSWVDQGRDVKPVSVNLSRVSAYSPSTVPILKDLVRRYDIDPALLEIELTESAYIDEPEKIKQTLCELQSAGFKILMDDFGSGYSSLNTLRNLPVDVLKLDIGFLTENEEDERGLIVISSVLEMTKRLGLPVIAEGVETEEQANYLRDLGCEYVQGFYFARPMPVEQYEQLED